jgi:hypothetical protein
MYAVASLIYESITLRYRQYCPVYCTVCPVLLQDKYGFTVLHHAVYRGNVLAVRNLYEQHKEHVSFQVVRTSDSRSVVRPLPGRLDVSFQIGWTSASRYRFDVSLQI